MKKSIQKLNNLKYRYKLTLLILAAGLLPVTIISAYFLRGMVQNTQKQEEENMYKIIEQSVDIMENQALIYKNLIDYLSYSNELRSIVVMEPTSDYLTYQQYINVADPLLQMPQIYHKEIKKITLYADSIEVPHGNTLMPLRRAEAQIWYSKLEDTSLMQWTIKQGANPRITVSRRFYEGQKSNAVLAMDLDYDSMLSPFSNRLTENMGGLILDDNNEVVYSECFIESAYYPKEPESLRYIKTNYSYFGEDMESTGWKLCLYCPRERLTDAVTSLVLESLPVVCLCILALVLVGYFFARGMVSPLERLTENMNQIHLGFRKVTVTSNSNDEAGVLIRSFGRMMDEMNRLISQVYEAKIKLQNTEMKALQAQINPHFLYNSLSIINWKALEVGEDEISKVTLALSTYYRTSLNRGETMTTVENEINNIRAYLRIQIIMHDHSFKAFEEFDPEVGRYVTPKLILQPLVENAIDHGLDMSEKEEKKLWIIIREKEEKILFEVRDNGIGMEQEKAEEILTYKSSGYGLRNVCDRIKVLYGEKGSMSVQSLPGTGTSIQIIIPKSTGENE